MNEIKITFIRHGTTANNVEGRWSGRSDSVLLDSSKKQISDMVKKYPYQRPDWIVSSPLLRCIETTKLSFPTRDFEVFEDLQEMSFGICEGELVSETFKNKELLKKWVEQDTTFRLPKGESTKELAVRVDSVIRRIITIAFEKNYKNVAVVTHGMVMSVMLSILAFGLDVSGFSLTPNGMGITFTVNKQDLKTEKPLKYFEDAPKNAPRPDMSKSKYFNSSEE